MRIANFKEHTERIVKIMLIEENKFISASEDCTAKLVNLFYPENKKMKSEHTLSFYSDLTSFQGNFITDLDIDAKFTVLLSTYSGFVHM